MSGGHAPYIMPDGRSLTAVLRAEGPTQGPSSKRKNSTRPKDELWGQLQLNKVMAAAAGMGSRGEGAASSSNVCPWSSIHP